MNTPNDSEQVFEIGLVLAGAVSAGAYTAGVIDYLVEKLEAFEAYKQDHAGEPLCPKHKVVIKVISGASAGAMTGVLAAANFAGEPDPEGSRLKRAWVDEIDIEHLLAARDIGGSEPLTSLLDSTVLDDIVENALKIDPRTALPDFVAKPLNIFLSVTNLRGVPYSLAAAGTATPGHEMMRHADNMRFTLFDVAQTPAPSPDDDAIPLARGQVGPEDPNWTTFGQAALASGAFPGGLKPRVLRRRASDYQNRVWRVPKEKGGEDDDSCFELVNIAPNFPEGMPDEYEFLNVDGGVMNNEPLELAREFLAGPGGRNPRGADVARKAVLMVDPFPEPAGFGLEYTAEPDLVSVAGQMLGALKMQARFKPDELRLAGDSVTFSRFLIAPTRRETDGAPTDPAITAAVMGAFGGFLSQLFRTHDYALGRRNCEKFLKDWFRLDANNPVFGGWRDATYVKPHPGADFESLPIIPIRHPGNIENPLPRRPRGNEVDTAALRKHVKIRVDQVVKRLIKTRLGNSVPIKLAWKLRFRKKAVNKVMATIEAELAKLT